MRLHYILFVTAATLLATTDVVSAGANSPETKLSTMTGTDTASVALLKSDGKRSLRVAEEDEDEDDLDEERALPYTLPKDAATVSHLLDFLVTNSAVTREVALAMKKSGYSVAEIAEAYKAYIKLT